MYLYYPVQINEQQPIVESDFNSIHHNDIFFFHTMRRYLWHHSTQVFFFSYPEKLLSLIMYKTYVLILKINSISWLFVIVHIFLVTWYISSLGKVNVARLVNFHSQCYDTRRQLENCIYSYLVLCQFNNTVICYSGFICHQIWIT